MLGIVYRGKVVRGRCSSSWAIGGQHRHADSIGIRQRFDRRLGQTLEHGVEMRVRVQSGPESGNRFGEGVERICCGSKRRGSLWGVRIACHDSGLLRKLRRCNRSRRSLLRCCMKSEVPG